MPVTTVRRKARSGFMAASYVMTLVDALRQLVGDEADAILAKAGIASDDLARPDGRIPVARVDAFWREAVVCSGEPSLGLQLGMRARPAAFHLLGHLMVSAQTLGEAIAHATRWSVLVGPDIVVKLETGPNEARLIFQLLNSSVPHAEHRIEAVTAAALNFARWATGLSLTPKRVAFVHRRIESPDRPYRKFFKSPIAFGAKENALLFPAAVLALPMQGADSGLNAVLQSHAEQRLPSEWGIDTARYEVRKAIQSLLSAGEPPLLESIAALLAMSPRSLQRRLGQLDATLNGELAAVRQEMAAHYLHSTDLSIDAIATRLGYSEISAFTRAYRNWTGQAPSRERAALRAAA